MINLLAKYNNRALDVHYFILTEKENDFDEVKDFVKNIGLRYDGSARAWRFTAANLKTQMDVIKNKFGTRFQRATGLATHPGQHGKIEVTIFGEFIAQIEYPKGYQTAHEDFTAAMLKSDEAFLNLFPLKIIRNSPILGKIFRHHYDLKAQWAIDMLASIKESVA